MSRRNRNVPVGSVSKVLDRFRPPIRLSDRDPVNVTVTGHIISRTERAVRLTLKKSARIRRDGKPLPDNQAQNWLPDQFWVPLSVLVLPLDLPPDGQQARFTFPEWILTSRSRPVQEEDTELPY